MTKKQRNNYYRQCYERVLKRQSFICIILQDLYRKNNKVWVQEWQLEDLFPEFLLFKTPRLLGEGGGWWNQSDLESRLNALAFCIAMTE